MLGGGGEVDGFHVIDVLADGVVDHGAEVGVAAEELRREALVDAEHVLEHQHLAVDARAGTDADNGYRDLGSNAGGERRGYLLEYEREAADFLEHLGVGDELFGLGLFLGAHGVGAELVDRLRRQAQVAHHGDAGGEDALDRFADLGAAFDLDGFGAAFLHDADGRAEGFLRVALI